MNNMLKFLTVIILVSAVDVAAQEEYLIDPQHTEFGFTVTHLVINKVRGKFNDFDGTIVLDDNGKLVDAEVTIKVASIDTEIKGRDDHLRSADFFDVEKFEHITFKATKIRRRIGRDVIFGKLTIRDVTRRVALPYELLGPITDPWGNRKIGLSAKTTVKRSDFGLTWNRALESGGVMVGEEIKIMINLEASLVEE